MAAGFSVIHTWHFDVNINTVEDGSGDVFLIFGYDGGCRYRLFVSRSRSHRGRDSSR